MRIYTRTEWAARYDDGQPGVTLRLPYAETWFHHSVTAQLEAAASFADECKAMRAIEQIGEDRFGQGISYTWIIFPSGRVYQGHSVNRRGTHTAGRNDIARAICFAGNYETSDLTGQQVSSAAGLLQHAHAAGWSTNRTANGGHRDLKQTACPGQHAYRRIPDINYLASGQTTEDDMPLTTADIGLIVEAMKYQVLHGNWRPFAASRNWGDMQVHQADLAATADTKLSAHGELLLQIRNAVTGIESDPAEDWAKVEAAAERGAARALEEKVLPAVRTVLADELGEDNAAQADAIVSRLASRLAD